jgi:hypothetical protein
MKNFTRITLAGLLSLLGSPFLHASLIYDVTINTAPLSGISGFMAFDLNGGIPLQDNVATITSFSSNSTLVSSSTSGHVTGTLTPGPLILTADTSSFNEWLQVVTFGTLTTFVLNVTTLNPSGVNPDSFAFFLLNSSQIPYGTTDPSGSDAIFVIDLTGNSTAPQVFTSTNPTAPQFTATVTPATAAPEASPAPIVGLGLAAILALRFLPKKNRTM